MRAREIARLFNRVKEIYAVLREPVFNALDFVIHVFGKRRRRVVHQEDIVLYVLFVAEFVFGKVHRETRLHARISADIAVLHIVRASKFRFLNEKVLQKREQILVGVVHFAVTIGVRHKGGLHFV